VLTQTYATPAILRSRTESPFVLPTAMPLSWPPAGSVRVDASGLFAAAHRTRLHDTGLMAVNPATIAGTDARVTAKQDRPPRGVPR
jgi:hypothetical protein